MSYEFLQQLTRGLPTEFDALPETKFPGTHGRDPALPHAPNRLVPLDDKECQLAVRNALRYFPSKFHSILSPEFELELHHFGHIYMYRFTPSFDLKAYPIDAFPARLVEARAVMLMICNNLDRSVAQFPQELVTYGGNGQTLSNWAQFWLVMKYLAEMGDGQSLVMSSGHPLGLFPTAQAGCGPRVIISNGMVIPNYSSPMDYDRNFALGVSMYGQMTAGSYCYIGPQGIVHGTTVI